MLGWVASIGQIGAGVSLSVALFIVLLLFFIVLPRGYEVTREGVVVCFAFRFFVVRHRSMFVMTRAFQLADTIHDDPCDHVRRR